MNPSRCSVNACTGCAISRTSGEGYPAAADQARRSGGPGPAGALPKTLRASGSRQDPCVLDVFLSITRFLAGEEPRRWWAYTAERANHMPTYERHPLMRRADPPHRSQELVDITETVQAVVERSGTDEGLVLRQERRAAVMIQENWDESVQEDVIDFLSKQIPREGGVEREAQQQRRCPPQPLWWIRRRSR